MRSTISLKELKTFLQEDGSYRYAIQAPDFVVDREERPHYEKDRFASMEANLKSGNVLFDVGSELGWQSAIYERFVGPKNMCLFEPHAELWPTIKETWDLNLYSYPRASYCGFVSDRTTDGTVISSGWPKETEGPSLTNFSTWSVIHSNARCPEVTLDDVVRLSGVVPDALTIDVEGAEFRVIYGAANVLRERRPLVWLSVHPELRLKSFDVCKKDVLDFMANRGYNRQYLGVDHEEHYFFYPEEKKNDVVFVNSPWKTYGKRNMSFEEAIPDWQDCMGMPYPKSWGAR